MKTPKQTMGTYTINTAIKCPACGYLVVFDGADVLIAKARHQERQRILERVEGEKIPELVNGGTKIMKERREIYNSALGAVKSIIEDKS
jgi:adenine-specific DNA methylase